MSALEAEGVAHKQHRERKRGRKADKKKVNDPNQKNPKAFTFNSAIKAERRFRRNQDIETKKQHIPVVDRTPVEPPPVLVAVVGPPKVGKSLVIQCLIKSFTKQPLTSLKGPITLVSGKRRRITFIECNNDINSMIDIAKVADLVLLLIDASFGFEMEIFEFLNICQVHGMPRIMGVLTHLDLIKNVKQMRKTKKTLKQRFWTEVYAGAKLFYLSGLLHEEYLRMEIKNLARFISVMKFRPLTWRSTHPYLLVDRVEDLTNAESIRQNPKIDRNVSMYGYVRGIPLNKQSSIHIPGCGDLKINDITFLPDPCPLPEQLKKRALVEKERLIYAPFSGVGGIVYDKDAVYVELGGSHSHTKEDSGLIGQLLQAQQTLDYKLEKSELQFFTDSAPIKSQDVHEVFNDEQVYDQGRMRRKVIFDDDVSKTENYTIEMDDGKKLDGKELDSCDDNENEPEDDNEDDNEDSEQEYDDSNDESDEEYIIEKEHLTEHGTNLVKPPKKKIKLESESNIYSNRSNQLCTDQDKDIKNKISKALNLLEDKSTGISENKNLEDDESYDELSDDEEKNFSLHLDSDNQNDEEYEEKLNSDNSNEDSDSEDNEKDDNLEDLKWKDNIVQKAREAFLHRQQSNVNIMRLVYGTFDEEKYKEVNREDLVDDKEDEIGGIFHVVDNKEKKKIEERELKNQEECVFFSKELTRDWLEENNKIQLIDNFVTGKWKDSEDAEELLKLDDLNDEEVYGDFEDLETGQKHEAKSSDQLTSANSVSKEESHEDYDERKKMLAKKKKLKEQFDAEYDTTDKSFYDDLKQEVERQAEINKSEFENLDDGLRVALEGYRPGMYVRIEIEKVPCELITNLDPTYPIIIGGLLPGEENIGYVQTRIKKHRWYPKILKSKDPLIVSVGWRRFQTLAIFSKLEDNLRNRMLKYTPEHVACMGHFWGPITPQGTGILAVQDVAKHDSTHFRIAATGSIVELDQSSKIVKKLKLVGVPYKIYKKTAFIKDMFNSSLEVVKFESARIKTVSGIRGQIKKAVSKPEGCFRATFEDKIKLSDIIFCRTWIKIDVPRFYNPVTSLLLPLGQKSQWQGMKTTGELKHEANIRIQPNPDNLYTPVERESKVFKPLYVPRTLQKELPYKDKPKVAPIPRKKHSTYEDRRVAVVREPREENIARMMRMIRTNYAHKQEKLKEETHKRMNEYERRVKEEEAKKVVKQKEVKKQVFRELSKLEIKKNKAGTKR